MGKNRNKKSRKRFKPSRAGAVSAARSANAVEAAAVPARQLFRDRLKPVHLTLLLSIASGYCGLSYEIIYVRLMSNFFGDGYHVAATVLATLFFGISFGAWFSRRLSEWLWLIEILIGMAAMAIALIVHTTGFSIVTLGGVSAFVTVLKLFALLVAPAFLIGTCVPLFAGLVTARTSEEGKGRAFARTYGLYNFGAFISVLMIEFWLLRQFGMTVTMFATAAVNIMTGLVLFFARIRQGPGEARASSQILVSRTGLSVLLAGIASGIFQLFVLKFSFQVFGPFHENFAMVLSLALLGIFFSPVLLRWFGSRLDLALVLGALSVVVAMLLAAPIIGFWAGIANTFDTQTGYLGAKIALLTIFALPAFCFVGAVVPLAVARLKRGEQGSAVATGGAVLAVSSAGNGIGALLMISALNESLDLHGVVLIEVGGLLLAALLVLPPLRPARWSLACGMAAVVLAGLSTFTWPGVALDLGYKTIASPGRLEQSRNSYAGVENFKHRDQAASLVEFADGSSKLVLNGYVSLTFSDKTTTSRNEVIVGGSAALSSREANNVLVLGLGSGISAGSASVLFDHVTVAEINPAMANVARKFSVANQGVMERKNVDIHYEDGIVTLLRSPDNFFDAIQNSVPSPQFYAASKLYSRDFYELVKTKLAPGGVYSGWFDIHVTQDGISIMMNTLERAFKHCRYYLMSIGYYNVVCAPDGFSDAPTDEQAARYTRAGLDSISTDLIREQSFAKMLEALRIDFGSSKYTRTTDEFSSLDRPVLEFTIAAPHRIAGAINPLIRAIEANILEMSDKPDIAAEFDLKCRALQVVFGRELAYCQSPSRN